MGMPDPDEEARRLAVESLDGDDPTGWFDRLYAAAERGETAVPWDRGGPHPLLVQWADDRDVDGAGRTALVVGSGPGSDAEYVAGRGFDTLAFDVSAAAVDAARRRFPDSSVRYRTADLLDPPEAWRKSFDLVVESLTVQSLPVSYRQEAIGHVAGTVGPGGTLLVIASAAPAGAQPAPGPPWPLARDEVDAFATDGLVPVRTEHLQDVNDPTVHRWRAEFHRPAPD